MLGSAFLASRPGAARMSELEHPRSERLSVPYNGPLKRNPITFTQNNASTLTGAVRRYRHSDFLLAY